MLTGKLDECEERETALKAELHEMSLRLEKLSNACTCHQSLGGLTEAASRTSKKKKKKHKRAHTQVDNCVPHPDHDYVGDWGDCGGDTEVGDGTLASSEGEQEAVGPMECGEAHSASQGASEPESCHDGDGAGRSRTGRPARHRSRTRPAVSRSKSRARQAAASTKPVFAPLQADDDSWKLVAAERPRPKRTVLYVGNLVRKTTLEDVTSFITRRMNTVAPEIDPPVIHNGVIFLDEEKTDKPAGARITVDEIYKETLLAPTFWPRPIYTRIFVINKNASGALG